MSAYSLVVSSLLSLLSRVSSTTTSYVLHIVRHIESIKNFMSAPITTAYDILVEEKATEVIHFICQLPPSSSPPGCPRRPQCCRPLTNNCRWGEDSSNLSISAQCCGEWAADCRKQYTDRLFTKTLVKEEHFFLRI